MKTYNLLENDKFVEIINKQSRLIGIDHGKKNIGISICDENHSIATPLTTIEFTQLKFFITEIRNIIEDNNIEGIVVGNPINMDGSLGPRAQSARDFSLPLHWISSIKIGEPTPKPERTTALDAPSRKPFDEINSILNAGIRS